MAWPGGKDGAGVYQRLINQIPSHDVFVSAFLGDCAILRRKLPARLSIGIDRSRDNVDRWASSSPVPNLRLYCCCGVEWLKHTFALHLVASPKVAAVDRRRRPQNSAASAEAGPWDPAAVFGGPAANWFVYIDPPYLLAARRSRRKLYDCELTDEQHRELLVVAVRLPCRVMISHYPHPLYSQALAGWRSFRYRSRTRGGTMATEQVWCNYPEPAELHDARYVGGNKRERERVHRRVRNWIGGLARMGGAERQAVLDAIADRWALPPKTATPPAGLVAGNGR
jgi:hypothetical protein